MEQRRLDMILNHNLRSWKTLLFFLSIFVSLAANTQKKTTEKIIKHRKFNF